MRRCRADPFCRSAIDRLREHVGPAPSPASDAAEGGGATSRRTSLRREDSELAGDLDNRVDRAVEMLARVGCADLTSQPRLPLRDDRKSEPGHVNASIEKLRGHGDGLRSIADEDRHDRMDPFANTNIP